MYIRWSIALSLLLFTACGIFRKQTAETHRSIEEDYSSEISGSSSHYGRLLEASSLMELRLCHIALLPPDSMGRQYPKSVTLAEKAIRCASSQHDTITSQASTAISTDRVATLNTSATSKQQASGYNFSFTVVLLIALILVIAYFKKHF